MYFRVVAKFYDRDKAVIEKLVGFIFGPTEAK
jgi:hypothetical protein